MYKSGDKFIEVLNGQKIERTLTAKEAKELNKAIEAAEAEQDEEG